MANATMARGILLMIIGAVCWGFSATCIQLLVTNWNVAVEWVTAVRLAIAGPTFLLVATIGHQDQLRRLMHDKRNLGIVLAFGLIGILGTQLSYFYCTSYTNAGTATTLERLALLFILGWSCLTARRMPFIREVVGVVLAFIGVFVIATQGNPRVISLPLAGLAWGLGDAIGTACYMIMPERPLLTYHPLVITGTGMTFAGIVANFLLQPWNIPIELTSGLAWIMFLLIAVGTIAAYAFYLEGVKACGAMLAGMLSCLVPVSAIAISAVWLGTPVSIWDIVGCALILGMVVIVTKSTSKD